MKRRSTWKLVGLAGLAGVVATGVALARSQRQRRSYTPEDVRARLQHRLASVDTTSAMVTPPDRTQPDQHGFEYVSRLSASHGPRVSVGDTVSEPLTLEQAVELTRTADLWLFRGPSVADRAIRTFTNSPVNHVGMAVVLEDLPPLMWHAELGQSLLDVWTGTRHRGVQLHDLREAVTTWSVRYRQDCWLRQLDAAVTKKMEDMLLQEIARKDGMPFPATLALAGHWARGRLRQPAPAEGAYCAEVVASSYQAMGLLTDKRPPNWYDPGRFWSGDRLDLLGGAKLGGEIEVLVGSDTDTDTTRIRHRSKRA